MEKTSTAIREHTESCAKCGNKPIKGYGPLDLANPTLLDPLCAVCFKAVSATVNPPEEKLLAVLVPFLLLRSLFAGWYKALRNALIDIKIDLHLMQDNYRRNTQRLTGLRRVQAAFRLY